MKEPSTNLVQVVDLSSLLPPNPPLPLQLHLIPTPNPPKKEGGMEQLVGVFVATSRNERTQKRGKKIFHNRVTDVRLV